MPTPQSDRNINLTIRVRRVLFTTRTIYVLSAAAVPFTAAAAAGSSSAISRSASPAVRPVRASTWTKFSGSRVPSTTDLPVPGTGFCPRSMSSSATQRVPAGCAAAHFRISDARPPRRTLSRGVASTEAGMPNSCSFLSTARRCGGVSRQVVDSTICAPVSATARASSAMQCGSNSPELSVGVS
jgi:hypothetical protein